MRENEFRGLNVIRVFAFLEIFSCHARTWGRGQLGVSLFFVLSGFLLSCKSEKYLNYDNASVISFSYAKKRIMKLYPLHICMLFVAIFDILINEGIKKILAASAVCRIACHVFLIQAWIPIGDVFFSMNGVSWYLSAAFLHYMLFPYVFTKIKKCKSIELILYGVGIVILQVIVLVIIKILCPSKSFYVSYVCPFFRLGDFIIGCLLGRFFYKLQYHHSRVSWRGTCLEVIVIFALLSYYLVGDIIGEYLWFIGGGIYSVFALPISCAAIFVFAMDSGSISRRLGVSKTIRRIAKLSSYAFLIHYYVVIMIRPELDTPFLLKLLYAIIAFVITMVLALIAEYSSDLIKNKEKEPEK